MIEINLLPGAGKKRASRGGGAKIDFASMLSGLSGKVKDKFLAAAVISVVVAGLAIGTMYSLQARAADDLSARDRKAVQDSSHFAAVVADRQRSEAKRDTLLRQLNIIKAIDDDRYIWPHIMDEVSRALPAYTWLTDLVYTGTPQGTVSAAIVPSDTSKKAKSKAKRLPTEVPHDSVHIRLSGRTVDIQALTRFMKQLEASPFLGDVQLERSEMVIDGGQQVTQFNLTLSYTRPDTSDIRRVALGAPAK